MGQTASSKIGLYIYAAATIASGAVNLIWGAFAAGYQPIQAFGVTIPGERILADVFAVALVIGGALLLARGTVRIGAVVLALIYFIFAVFWMPRLITAPQVLGYHVAVYAGVLDGVCQQLILAAAAALLYAASLGDAFRARTIATVARWVFGLSSIDFGLAHWLGMAGTARLVPAWLPLGGNFWTGLTGICFLLAGIAILIGLLDALAAWLLGAMLLVFSAIVLAPMIFEFPRVQNAWASNGYNLAAVGAAWVLAGYLAARKNRGAA